MYSMVLMAAMLPSGDAAGFGKKNNGCNGGCHGTVVVAGCSGSGHGHGHHASAGCNGSSCHGGGSCHGDRGHFLGHRDRSGCNGGGFLGKHKNRGHSCNGGCSGSGYAGGCSGSGYGGGCSGYVPAVPAGPVVVPAPAAMPPR